MPTMRPYARPYHTSTRLRHLAAGAGSVLVVVTLLAASHVGIAPVDAGEPPGVVVDVVALPCDAPSGETPSGEEVEVVRDTLDGQPRIHVVVGTRQGCAAEGDLGGPALRRQRLAGRGAGAPAASARTSAPPDSISDTTASDPARVGSLAPLSPRPPSGVAPAPSGNGVALSAPPASAARVSQPQIPLWIALGAGALYVVAGREDRPPGGVCEDEVGRNSGPSRTGCWPRARAVARSPRLP